MNKKEIIKKISSIKSAEAIIEFIEQNNCDDILYDSNAIELIKRKNPNIEKAIELYQVNLVSRNLELEIQKNGLKSIIDSPEKLRLVSSKRKEELYLLAKQFEDSGEYDKAKACYKRIIEFGKSGTDRFRERQQRAIRSGHNSKWDKSSTPETLYYRSTYSYIICKLKNNEPLDNNDIVELQNLLKSDQDNILNLSEKGKIKSIDFVLEFFGKDMSIEQLADEILPQDTGERKGEHNPVDPRPGTKDYPESLSPTNRLKFIRENFNIKNNNVKMGKDKLKGYVIFQIEETGIYIIEKFFDEKATGEIVPSKDAATYLVHPNANIDISKISRGELAEKKKNQELKLIEKINHTEGYYKRFFHKVRMLEKSANMMGEQDIMRDGMISEQFFESIADSEVQYDGQQGNIPDSEENPNEEMQQPQDDHAGVLEDDLPKEEQTVEALQPNNQEEKLAEEMQQPEDDHPDIPEENSQPEGLQTEEIELPDILDDTATLIDLTNQILSYDKRFAELEKEKTDLARKVEDLKNNMNAIKEAVKAGILDVVTDSMMEIITNQLKTLSEQRTSLDSLKAMQAEIEQNLQENRSQRAKLTQRFNARVDRDDEGDGEVHE